MSLWFQAILDEKAVVGCSALITLDVARSIVTWDICELIGVRGDDNPVFCGLRYDGFLILNVDMGIFFGSIVFLGTFHLDGSDVHDGVGSVRL